jgi:hypothetical protein
VLYFLGQGQGAGRPDRAGQGLFVCLTGQGRVRLSVCLSVLQGRAGSVCPSVCLSCKAGQGPSVRLFVCLAGQGRAGQGPSVRLFVCLVRQGRVRLSVYLSVVQGRARSVCPSVCLSCRAGQGPSVRLSLLQGRARGRARRAGQGPNKE